MKVAIIGAGLSGLSCALELERHGIKPDIFEKKDYIGEECDMTAVRLHIFETRLGNALNYMKKQYKLVLRPYDIVRNITMKSQSREVEINGKLGYMFLRGNKPEAIESQIVSRLNSRIYFNKMVWPSDLADDYQYIVVANGNPNVPEDMDLWIPVIKGFARLGTLAGNVVPSSLKIWFNTSYSRNCFCALAPGKGTTSMLMMVADGISHNELEHYWIELVENELQDMRVLETRDKEFDVGRTKLLEYGKLLFTGNAGGFLESFVGFGIFEAIESGFMAARSIALGLSYARQAARLLRHRDIISSFRKLVATFNNDDYDRLLALISLPVIKQLIYKNPLFRSEMLSPIARLASKKKSHNLK